MPKIKADAVIFDKDGTLIDFDAFWITMSRASLKDILHKLHQDEALVEEMLEAFGVHDGKTDISGILCKGTYGDMAQEVRKILQLHGCAVSDSVMESMVLEAYNAHAHLGDVQPACPNLRQVLEKLKKQGKKIALVTTDNTQISLFCLQKLGIADLFDHIYADGGPQPVKPDPASALDFCARENIRPEQVIMVGDTMTDIRFARNAGLLAIAVARNEESRNKLQENADVVLHDVSELVNILE